ncbi:hypothetical protein BO78DRAFT_420378 [Aspergillus sclerotiicarbonarius CBS 121057]|uniref:Uncharacterized protein n=1 Tax=Aspergillus sclerotiicarbonarius (strain CBS 121057 / IBT 28362) TaxID=1448318 RepID=A0A319E947_ASPSB|nr:hypothetical protein BO78DRAFT_420378 [Aspergillus sclerotiicarbonarius CBS 121057]
MSDMHVSKQARANETGDAHVRLTSNSEEGTPELKHTRSEEKALRIRDQVNSLDNENLANIVIKAAEDHPDSVWKTLNITYQRLSGTNQFDMAGEVEEDIIDTIERITEQCGPSANLQTRYNGLSVLRKIGKSIALSYDTLAHEVRKRFQWDTTMEDSMMKIIGAMEPQERLAIYRDNTSPEALWPKLLELGKLAEGYCVFKGFPEVLDLLQGDEDPEEPAELDDGEDEESDDE